MLILHNTLPPRRQPGPSPESVYQMKPENYSAGTSEEIRLPLGASWNAGDGTVSGQLASISYFIATTTCLDSLLKLSGSQDPQQ